MSEVEEDVLGRDSDAEGETNKEEEEDDVEEFGIAVTRGFSTTIQGNLPSPIHNESMDDNDRTIDAEVEVAAALEKVLEVENTLAAIIAKRDLDLAAIWKKLAAEYAESMEQKSTQSLKTNQDQAKNDEIVMKGVLTRNQALTRTVNRPPGSSSKRERMSRVNLSSCLQIEDQKRKDDAEKWLKVCIVALLHSNNFLT